MKLSFAFFALLLNPAFSQDPWSIQPGTVEMGPNGDTLKISHILGDGPLKARVTIFDKGFSFRHGHRERQSHQMDSQTIGSATVLASQRLPLLLEHPGAMVMVDLTSGLFTCFRVI